MARIARITAHRLKECEISAEKWAHFTKWKTSEEWIDDETFGRGCVSETVSLNSQRIALEQTTQGEHSLLQGRSVWPHRKSATEN